MAAPNPFPDFDPISSFRAGMRKGPPWQSIVDFATHPSFCGLRLYPRQMTLLKLIYLETEQMTQYDFDVIEGWRTGFKNRKKQCAELARQGVKFTVRWDGFPLVLLSQFEPTPDAKAKRKTAEEDN